MCFRSSIHSSLYPVLKMNCPAFYLALFQTLAVLKLLLLDPRVNPACRRNLPLIYAATTGLPAAISLLLSDPRIDPSDCDNYAVRIAAQRGHVPALRLLLGDVRVDPTAKRSQAIREAGKKKKQKKKQGGVGDMEISSSTKNPSLSFSTLSAFKASLGRTDALKFLLRDGRADPAAEKNEAIREACRNGHTPVVQVKIRIIISDDQINRRREKYLS